MKNWIKKKFRLFLEIDIMEQFLISENQKLKDKLKRLELLNEIVIKESEKIKEENNFILSQFNISADINHYENHSWAIISIQGKPEYVKFVNLSNQDMRSVHSFLKQFERTNRIIDSPMTFLKF